ncbi:UNVERIFIED_CONTAM: putative pentatricopeptide repeat-containing protein, mitochondrial [Sesamum angustifolium]|uniref:Pentatricopeptide repeat-containing protein, mitochondrial n=1 Tax=Sesamum angustifolium TaxID=2727405 RepID=A0AAW2ILZ3_9LAMI
MRFSTMALVRRAFAAKKRGIFIHPLPFLYSSFHNLSHKKRPFSPKPRIDFSCIHEVDGAVFLFRQMLRMRPQPSVVQFTKLLNIVVKMKQYPVALHLFDEMGFFKRGYEPNVTTFNTLIKGLFLDDKVIEAEKLFKKLLTLKLCEPNEVTVLTVINGLCKAGHTLTAYELLGLFEKTSFKLDVYSYSTVIDSLCKDRMVDDALQLLAKMIDKGISPNIVTYSSLLKGLCNFGRWKDAKDLITGMVDHKGLEAFIISYNSLINGYCKNGRVEDAWSLFLEVPRKGLEYNVVTYNTMLHGLFGADRCADGLKLFKDMQAEQVIPNLVTYNTLLHGLCMNKQIAEAFSFLHIMEEKGVNPNITTYNTLIHGLRKAGKLEIARNLFKRPSFKRNGKKCCAPDTLTYDVLIKHLLERNELSEAKTFLDKMCRQRLSLNSIEAMNIDLGGVAG